MTVREEVSKALLTDITDDEPAGLWSSIGPDCDVLAGRAIEAIRVGARDRALGARLKADAEGREADIDEYILAILGSKEEGDE